MVRNAAQFLASDSRENMWSVRWYREDLKTFLQRTFGPCLCHHQSQKNHCVLRTWIYLQMTTKSSKNEYCTLKEISRMVLKFPFAKGTLSSWTRILYLSHFLLIWSYECLTIMEKSNWRKNESWYMIAVSFWMCAHDWGGGWGIIEGCSQPQF